MVFFSCFLFKKNSKKKLENQKQHCDQNRYVNEKKRDNLDDFFVKECILEKLPMGVLVFSKVNDRFYPIYKKSTEISCLPLSWYHFFNDIEEKAIDIFSLLSFIVSIVGKKNIDNALSIFSKEKDIWKFQVLHDESGETRISDSESRNLYKNDHILTKDINEQKKEIKNDDFMYFPEENISVDVIDNLMTIGMLIGKKNILRPISLIDDSVHKKGNKSVSIQDLCENIGEYCNPHLLPTDQTFNLSDINDSYKDKRKKSLSRKKLNRKYLCTEFILKRIEFMEDDRKMEYIVINVIDQTKHFETEFFLSKMVISQLDMLSEQMPRHIIEHLVNKNKSKMDDKVNSLSRKHYGVSIMFLDIVGFTRLSKQIGDIEVMSILNNIFTKLDELTSKYNVQKVETAGDCYIVSAGVLSNDLDKNGFQNVEETNISTRIHAQTLLSFAKHSLCELKLHIFDKMEHYLSVRIGIHTGDVVSGLIGTKLPKFSLFGETMNIASRMESTGEPGRIQVSKKTRDILFDENWESTTNKEVKGIGFMETYMLKNNDEFCKQITKDKEKSLKRKSSFFNICQNQKIDDIIESQNVFKNDENNENENEDFLEKEINAINDNVCTSDSSHLLHRLQSGTFAQTIHLLVHKKIKNK